MKGIVFTKEQIEARENGATMFMIPLGEDLEEVNKLIGVCEYQYPIKIGDEFFIQEEFQTLKNLKEVQKQPIVKDIGKVLYKNYQLESNKWNKEWAMATIWKDASQMQEHQSRYKDICLGIEVKRAGDIFMNEVECCKMMGNVIDDTFPYKNDDYVFLISCKGIQK